MHVRCVRVAAGSCGGHEGTAAEKGSDNVAGEEVAAQKASDNVAGEEFAAQKVVDNVAGEEFAAEEASDNVACEEFAAEEVSDNIAGEEVAAADAAVAAGSAIDASDAGGSQSTAAKLRKWNKKGPCLRLIVQIVPQMDTCTCQLSCQFPQAFAFIAGGVSVEMCLCLRAGTGLKATCGSSTRVTRNCELKAPDLAASDARTRTAIYRFRN